MAPPTVMGKLDPAVIVGECSLGFASSFFLEKCVMFARKVKVGRSISSCFPSYISIYQIRGVL